MIERVCSSCFGDADLRAWIRAANGARGCDACGRSDSPTSDFSDLCEHIESCLKQYWSFANESLPYETAEGGYLGNTWSTYEILLEHVALELPRDDGDLLLNALLNSITDELWCEYDWLSLDYDVALGSSWDRFCEIIKHKRRFFFHSLGDDDGDSFSPLMLLKEIAEISESIGLIRDLPAGVKLWRARTDILNMKKVGAVEFAPPPAHLALQSNRMNPPGIPVMYASSSAKTALRETREAKAWLGQWQAVRSLRVLDLRHLPEVPGYFSGAPRKIRLGKIFLRAFAADITLPVARDNRNHIDYLPSQVVAEFLRDFQFESGHIDGVAFASTVHPSGWNVALFLGHKNLGLVPFDRNEDQDVWLEFRRARR